MYLLRGVIVAGAANLPIFAVLCTFFGTWNATSAAITAFNSVCFVGLVVDVAVLVWTGAKFDPPASGRDILEAYRLGLTRTYLLNTYEVLRREQAAARATAEQATLASIAAEEVARQERLSAIRRRLDRLNLSNAVSAATLERLSRSSSEVVERHFCALRELSAIISDCANIGGGAEIQAITLLFDEGQFDEARRVVGVERRRTAIRRKAAEAGACVESFLAQDDFQGAEESLRLARVMADRRRELDVFRQRISQLPPHHQVVHLDRLVVAEAVVAGTEREYKLATHPLRRQLER